MEFMEKSLFSPMALCFVTSVGCHVTADHLHMHWSGIFFCCKLFLQCIQMNSSIIYMSSCSTSSWTNCGHSCVLISTFSWDVCLCNFITYQCDKHCFTVSWLISYCVVWNSCTVLWNSIWWQHVHTYSGLLFQCFQEVCSCYCMWILSIIW